MDDVRLFDSHCHLDMEDFSGDIDGVLARAFEAGVRMLLLAACDEASSAEIFRLKERYGGRGIKILASAGIHPHEAAGESIPFPPEFTGMAYREGMAAVGEIGLDYYYENSPRNIQMEVFERQLDWAAEAGKPVIIHLRNAADRVSGDAYGEAMSVLRKRRSGLAGGVIHCFSGGLEDARAALDMGFYISIAGPVTYPKANELRDVAAFVPPDRLLCETDSPYLAPRARRGKRNEPALVREVYLAISEARGVSLEALASAVWDNGERLFKS
jgi:TatD DNase family protein